MICVWKVLLAISSGYLCRLSVEKCAFLFCPLGANFATSLGSISSSGTWQTNMGAAGPYVQILFSTWLTRTFDSSWSGWPTKSESSTLKTYMSNFQWFENWKQQERTFRHLQLVTTLDGLGLLATFHSQRGDWKRAREIVNAKWTLGCSEHFCAFILSNPTGSMGLVYLPTFTIKIN